MRKIFLIIILLILFVGAAYMQPLNALELISNDQEIQIGRETANQLEAKYGTVNDKAQLGRINKIGFKIVSVCGRHHIRFLRRI